MVPPESGKLKKKDLIHRIRNDEKTVRLLEKHRGIFEAAGVWGFVCMDRYFGVREAEGVGKDLKNVGMTPRAMTVKYMDQICVVENEELARFFQVPRPFEGEVPLHYETPKLTYEEAQEFLNEEGDFRAQWEEGKVNYGSIANEQRRSYVELVTKWVIVKAGHHSITQDHLAIAKALLEGKLHPLQVWKCGMMDSIRPKGLSKFPSLVNYVAGNVFSTVRLNSGHFDQPEGSGEREEEQREGSQVREEVLTSLFGA